MIIHTMWGTRKDEPTGDCAELMVAWDEYCVDYNPSGFTEACDKEIAEWGGELHATRFINVTIDGTVLEKAFEEVLIEGEAVAV